jgi:Flp pilus assembly pilin Flp
MSGTMARLGRDERGVGMVELALFAPIIAFMIIGITDIARAYSQKLMIEQAVYRALEKAAVGTVQTDYAFLKPEVATAAKVTLDKVTLAAWLECDGVKQPLFEGECTGNQMVSRYVELGVTAQFRPTFRFGLMGYSLFKTGTGGTSPLKAKAAVRIQ